MAVLGTGEGDGFDAIVVGSGPNGSWVAKELAERGWKVVVLDAGPILRDSLFTQEPSRDDVFNLRYQAFRLKSLLKGDRHGAFNKFIDRTTRELYLDRSAHPYTTVPGRDYAWFRVRAVGGRGHLWGRVMLRFTDTEFGRPGYEWPIRAGELEQEYGEVETVLELGGAPSTDPRVPDGRYVRPRQLNELEQTFCDAVERRWPERRAVVNHVAEYAPSPLAPMLRAAVETGNATLRPGAVVTRLHEGPNGSIIGVDIVDAESGRRETLRAGKVVLAASAFETTRLLLNSASDHHPGGVGNHSGLLGTRVLEHIMASVLDELPPSLVCPTPRYHHNSLQLNEEPHGFFFPAFSATESPSDGPFGYGVQGTISTDTGLFYVGAFGETVPSDHNRLRLDRSRLDRHGVPVAEIDYRWSTADTALFDRARLAVGEMIEEFERAAGVRLRSPLATRLYSKLVAERPVPGSNHECGGARMGSTAETGVTDPYGRVWSAPNVVVCDTSVFPSIPHQNPTLTSMALAVRAARSLVVEAGDPTGRSQAST